MTPVLIQGFGYSPECQLAPVKTCRAWPPGNGRLPPYNFVSDSWFALVRPDVRLSNRVHIRGNAYRSFTMPVSFFRPYVVVLPHSTGKTYSQVVGIGSGHEKTNFLCVGIV